MPTGPGALPWARLGVRVLGRPFVLSYGIRARGLEGRAPGQGGTSRLKNWTIDGSREGTNEGQSIEREVIAAQTHNHLV
eukprot:scaffold123723_cov30-Tisochrysis_lutea.AAC.2